MAHYLTVLQSNGAMNNVALQWSSAAQVASGDAWKREPYIRFSAIHYVDVIKGRNRKVLKTTRSTWTRMNFSSKIKRKLYVYVTPMFTN
jgi:hypothetical protein